MASQVNQRIHVFPYPSRVFDDTEMVDERDSRISPPLNLIHRMMGLLYALLSNSKAIGRVNIRETASLSLFKYNFNIHTDIDRLGVIDTRSIFYVLQRSSKTLLISTVAVRRMCDCVRCSRLLTMERPNSSSNSWDSIEYPISEN